jgi:hypothetical protein
MRCAARSVIRRRPQHTGSRRAHPLTFLGCKPASEAPADAGNQYSLRAQLEFVC